MPVIGQYFNALKSVDSTNNYAMRQVHAGLAKHGVAYLAYEQTAGKGQRGKTWTTSPGETITISLVLEPSGIIISNRFLLSIAIALGCYDLVNQYAGDDTKIKWPNDIYWRDRKAGGILVENVIMGSEWKFAIAGIGLNINQENFPDFPITPVSLKQITGKTSDIEALAKALCACLEMRYQSLLQGHGHELLLEYNDHLYKKNETIRIRKNNIVFEALVKNVNEVGELVTETAIQESFSIGEVEWIIR
jgi:BirA family biotin operon repressor/biotin-[acetyl-CoA-carboxylase] ligase